MNPYFLFFMTVQTGQFQITLPHLVSVPREYLPAADLVVNKGVPALADGAIAWHVAASCFGGQYTQDADMPGIEYDSGMIIAPAVGEAPVFIGTAEHQATFIDELKRSGMNTVNLTGAPQGQLMLHEQAYVALSQQPQENAAAGFRGDAKVLWARLGDTPVNDDGELEEPFLGFETGTDRETIWHWFEDVFNVCVAKDLMNLS